MRISRNGLALAFTLWAVLAVVSPLYAQSEEVWESEMQAGLAAINGARLDEAKKRFASAVRIAEGMLDRDRAATSLVNLADIYRIQGEYAESESLMRRAVALIEQLPGVVDAEIATALNNLAALLDLQGRFAEAVGLYLRALQIRERIGGAGGADLAVLLNNLGALYDAYDDAIRAEQYYRRAIELGRGTPASAMALSNAGVLYERLGRIDEAEAAFREALDRASTPGESRAEYATALHNLGALQLRRTAPNDEAEGQLRRSLDIRVRLLTAGHPDIAMTTYALAEAALRRGRLEDALALARDATRMLGARLARKQDQVRQAALSEQRVWRTAFLAHLRILHAAIAAMPARSDEFVNEAFAVAQLAKASDASHAVAAMAARFSAGGDDLARAVRANQDLLVQYRFVDAEIIRLAGLPQTAREAGKEQQMRRELERIAGELERADRDIGVKFPGYRALTGFEPVALADARGVLGKHEALASFLFGESAGFLIVSTHETAKLFELDIGRKELEHIVRNLRRHLDPERAAASAPPVFPVDDAVVLYDRLLRPAETLLAGRTSLIAVTDSALDSLPLSVLLTERPSVAASQGNDHAQYKWLIKRHALSYVPSVGSLRALRHTQQARRAELALAAFADPLLRGSAAAQKGRAGQSARAGKIADVEEVRQLSPLPETEDEVLAIAKSLGATTADIYLRADATEQRVKSMDLSRFRTIIFATHGLMAGDIASSSEPALVLTPPQQGSDLDDGLLTASEIAKLRLNADWVILSACNTAAADGTPGAEGLSGLAKAFFYAGSRALLVSHWAIASQATVELTTTMFREHTSDPASEKTEALRRAALHMIQSPTDKNYSHPMFWAPLVIVGEGGAR